MGTLAGLQPVRAYLRSLDPGLPRSVWLLQAGGLANAFGNGFVLPFLIIYLHNVRGISLAVAGLVAAANGAAALVSGPLAGTLADRIGARRTLIGALLVMAAAFACFPLIHKAWHALALNAVAGFGSGAFWPSQSSLLTGLTPPERRHAAFAQQRVTMNLGIGLGGAGRRPHRHDVGPVERSPSCSWWTRSRSSTFAAILARVPSPARVVHADDGGPTGYRAVLRDRAFRGFMLLNVLVITAGIVLLMEFLPVFAKNEASVSERSIGFIFFLNTLLIVLAQLPVAKALEGRSRMRAFALMGLIWAASWLLVMVAGLTLEAAAATAVLALAATVFAVGECLHGTVQGPLVADLAEPRAGRPLHGRLEPLVAGRVRHRAGARRLRCWQPRRPRSGWSRRRRPCGGRRARSAHGSSRDAFARRPSAGATLLTRRARYDRTVVMPTVDEPSVPMPSLPRIRRSRPRRRSRTIARREPRLAELTRTA